MRLQGCSPREKPKSHISWSRECRRVWGNEPSHSQVSSHFGSWSLKPLENNCRGQNPMDWGVPYIIGKPLELRCLKWARMTHLDTWNTSYGPKKWPGVRLAIWFPTIKSQESSWFPYMQVECDIMLESSWQRLQLCFIPHFNQKSECKVMGPQSCKSLSCENDNMTFGCWSCNQTQIIL